MEMMLFLPGDIFFNGFDLGETDGKDSISVLPREVMEVWGFAF
jgi:hypothetical protein